MIPENLLMVAAGEHDANMLYATEVLAPDPLIYVRVGGKCHIVVRDLELDRAQREANGCKILPWSRYERKLQKKGVSPVTTAHVVREVLRERSVRKVFIPSNFPYGLARQMRRLKIRLKIKEGEFFSERETKSAEEVKKISAALMMAEVGMAEGIHALKNSKAGKNGKLIYHHVPLTAEKLRAIIDTAVLQAGGQPNRTVVACGTQGCDPSERGHGLLRVNQPIILGISPRSQKTGYYGDITRTVVRGRASDSVWKAYQTVAEAQEIAFERLRHKSPCTLVHDAVRGFFESRGYKSGRQGGHMQGFCHGTGHGLGLESDEPPRLEAGARHVLKVGHVITVEPGLYYLGLRGGVRLEDVALVTSNGARNLTKFEKVLEV